MFEPRKYNSYINTLQATVILKNAVIIIAIIFVAIMTQKYFTTLFSILIGIAFSLLINFQTKIRIEEMKWKLDFYNKIINGKEG